MNLLQPALGLIIFIAATAAFSNNRNKISLKRVGIGDCRPILNRISIIASELYLRRINGPKFCGQLIAKRNRSSRAIYVWLRCRRRRSI